MILWIIIRSAIQSLMANKLRSLLAMLGIIIGVGAVIAMLAMGAGAQAQITARFTSMGTNLLFIRPAQRGTGGVNTGTQQTLLLSDALALTTLDGVDAISPVINNSVQAKYMNRNNKTTINGVAPTYFEMRNFEIDKGRVFTDAETEGLARVVLIGPNVARNLFGPDEPLNSMIKMNGISFKVVGILKTKGDQGWNSPDDQAFIPFSTAIKILFGDTYLKEIDVATTESADMDRVSGQPVDPNANPWSRTGTLHVIEPPEGSITSLLRKRHRLDSLAIPDDFNVQNQAELLANLSASITTFRILLGSIACISLLVGGIGIMNIMLVTVTERTREIGTRKAIGAQSKDILLQFLVESVVMSGVGGSLGAAMGVALAKGIPMIPIFSSFMTIVEPIVIVASISVAAGVGIFFGMYPAYRASQLDPIEALRYE